MNLREALEAADIEVRNGATEEEIWMCCPFCVDRGETPDTRFRLGVNLRSGQAQCFNCSWKARGDYTFSRLQQALSTGEIQAAQDLASKKRHHVRVHLPEDFEILQHPNRDTDHWNNLAYRYVRSRGVTDEQIKEHKIGYSVTHSNDPGSDMAYRVIFPVYVHGKLKGLVGRDFTGKQEPTYKNSTGGKALYNVQDHPSKTVCLLEGVWDTLAVERAVRKQNIDANGLLGHDLTDDQLELLDGVKRVILWMDPDKAGVEGIIGKHNNGGIYRKLKAKGISVYYIMPKGMIDGHHYDKRDPSEYDSHEIRKRIEHASRMNDATSDKLAYWKAFLEKE